MSVLVETYLVPKSQTQNYPGFLVVRQNQIVNGLKETTVSLSEDYSNSDFCGNCGEWLKRIEKLSESVYSCPACKIIL